MILVVTDSRCIIGKEQLSDEDAIDFCFGIEVRLMT